jgi:uncharacterized protein
VLNGDADFDGARDYALDRLARELSPRLYYHNLYHSRDEVAPAAARLAQMEGVAPAQRDLLLTAAYFHDIGFTFSPEGHELLGAEIAADVLPAFNFNLNQIQIIRGLILVTRLFTPPRSQLEAILVDADLDILGRENFYARNRQLRQEFAALGRRFSDRQWFTQQLRFLQVHQYHTLSAQATCDPQKRENMRLLVRHLARVKSFPYTRISAEGD